jgi:HEAT repeat protein
MKFRLSLIVASLFLLAILQPAPSAAPTAALPQTDDKKKDLDPKKEKEKEPEITANTKFEGKTLDDWMKLISDKDRSKTEVAIQMIMRYGPKLAMKAVPKLVAELQKHKKGVSEIDLSVRVNGCIALGMIMGSQPEPKDAAALNELKEVVGVLNKMLTDSQVIVRFRATQAIGQVGPYARELSPKDPDSVLKHLIKLVMDLDTWENRHAAVLALGTVAWVPPGKDLKLDPAVIDVLYSRLKYHPSLGPVESCLKVRLAILQVMNNLRFGEATNPKDVVEKVSVMAYNDPDPIAKLRAHMLAWPHLTAAEKLKREGAISKYLSSPEQLVRVEFLQMMSLLKKEDRKIFFAALKTATEDADPIFRLHAHGLMVPLLDGAAREQRLDLIGNKYLLENKEADVRMEAAKMLGQFADKATSQILQLVKALKDSEPGVVLWATWALGEMEKAAMSAIPFINAVIADEKMPEVVHEMAKHAVENITNGKKKVEPKKAGAS